jgi:hypothetical protein
MATMPTVAAAAFILTVSATCVDARPPVCERLMASFDALERATDWHVQTRAGSGEPLLSRKVGGRQQYQLPGTDTWLDLPESALAAGRSMVADMRTNPDAISRCEITGTGQVDGVPVTVIRAHIAPGVVPAYDAIFHLGADDLPRRMVSDEVQVDYRYDDD